MKTLKESVKKSYEIFEDNDKVAVWLNDYDLNICSITSELYKKIKSFYWVTKLVPSSATNGIVLAKWNDEDIDFQFAAKNMDDFKNQLIKGYHRLLEKTKKWYKSETGRLSNNFVPGGTLDDQDLNPYQEKDLWELDFFFENEEIKIGKTCLHGNIFCDGSKRLPTDKELIDRIFNWIKNTGVDGDSARCYAIIDMDNHKIICQGENNVNFHKPNLIFDED